MPRLKGQSFMSDDQHQDKIDPDLFESLLTAINTISTVGSFALAWHQTRISKQKQRIDIDRFQIKIQLSNIESQFTDAFRSLREIIALFRSVEKREGKHLSDLKIGFGGATYKFTSSEFQYYQNLSIKLNGSFSNVSSSTNSLIQMFDIGRVSGEDAIRDNLDGIHEQLNDILFSSPSFDQALLAVDELRDRVQGFLQQLENLGNAPA